MARVSPLAVLVCLGLALCLDLVSTESGNATEGPDNEDNETFQEFEKKVKNTMGSIIKNVLPFLMRGSADTKVSGQCIASVMKVIGGVRQLKEWAVRFIDSSGKLPAGILEGTSLSLGDYDECLDIRVGKRDDPPATPRETVFTGQYCLLELHRPQAINRAIEDFESGNLDSPIAKTKSFLNMFVRYKHLTNTTMKVGVCVPSKCTEEDLENIMNSETLRKQIGKVTVSYCKIGDEPEVTTTQIILLCLFGFYILVLILGTIADAIFRLLWTTDDLKPKQSSVARALLQKTSLYGNALNVLSTSTPCSIPCLAGLRTFIVAIIIYSHTYAHLHMLHFQKFAKSANFLKFFDSFTFSGIGNGSVVVESMVFISGVVITYNRWRFLPKGRQVDVRAWKLFIQRLFRFVLVQALTVCLFLLVPLFGSGPFWEAYMQGPVDNCYKRWWMNVLLINNFFESQDTCVYHSWVLSLMMQLTIFGMVVLWAMKRSITIGYIVMGFGTLAGIVGVGIMTVVHDLPGSMAFYTLDKRTFPIVWGDIYTLPYDHIGAFCVGLLAGYFLAIKKDRLEISRVLSAFLWCCAIATNMAVMFGIYSYRNGDKMDTPLATFYATMNRNAWSVGIAWLVIACSTHHGGPLSRVLKSKVFIPLDRMCYMAYMLHLPIMFFHSGTIRERWYMGHFEIYYQAISYIFLAFLAGFIANVVFVEPYLALEKHVTSLFKSKDKLIFATDKRPSVPSTLAETADNNSTESSACENLGYSKNIDGV